MKQLILSTIVGMALMSLSGAVLAANAPDAAQLEKGRVIFKTGAVPACAICHTLKDAGATGAIGPNLDELKPGFEDIVKTVKAGIGAMPSFSETLTEEQIDAVSAYVAHVTGGGK